MMIKIIRRIQKGKPVGRLTLPFELRVKARLRGQLDDGCEVGVFLDRGPIMRGGDLLEADDGSVIEVVAAKEEISVVKVENNLLFARACYHLGNRHVALQILDNELRYQKDSVLDEMMIKFGLVVQTKSCPFEPERGAYGEHGSDHFHAASYHH